MVRLRYKGESSTRPFLQAPQRFLCRNDITEVSLEYHQSTNEGPDVDRTQQFEEQHQRS